MRKKNKELFKGTVFTDQGVFRYSSLVDDAKERASSMSLASIEKELDMAKAAETIDYDVFVLSMAKEMKAAGKKKLKKVMS
jgi:hypothetical protein